MRRRINHEQRASAKIHQLTASRRKIAEAYEVERLRIERDLHAVSYTHLTLPTKA